MQNSYLTKAVTFLSICWFATAHAATPVKPVAETKDQSQHHKVVAEDSVKWRRDPFGGGSVKSEKGQAGRIQAGMKTVATISAAPDLNVQGIMQADSAFHALINGRVVKAGDKLDGVTIKEISRYRVTVQSENNKEKTIYDIYQGRIDRGKP
jgi:hypothetical protein